jgi:hypothetical protein
MVCDYADAFALKDVLICIDIIQTCAHGHTAADAGQQCRRSKL